jgi:hypothetical protein
MKTYLKGNIQQMRSKQWVSMTLKVNIIRLKKS